MRIMMIIRTLGSLQNHVTQILGNSRSQRQNLLELLEALHFHLCLSQVSALTSYEFVFPRAAHQQSADPLNVPVAHWHGRKTGRRLLGGVNVLSKLGL